MESSRSGFTLIELLVVIALLAVLAVVVILTLNPAGLLQESRDANRLSDLGTLNTALGLYAADVTSPAMGNASTVYPSIWDISATSTAGDQCQGSGMLTLPASYTWQCAPSSTYRSTSGTGWVPVNFSAISAGTPFSQLPIDPVNSTSSRRFYTYTTNGSQYEVTAAFESAKYKLGGTNDAVGNDGGTLATVYEKGSRLGLEPLDYGEQNLVGYWAFEEGSSSVAYDYSGNNATGSWSGTAAGTNGYYSAGKIGNWAARVNGSDDQVTAVLNGATLNDYSIVLWYDSSATSTDSSASIEVLRVGGTDFYPAIGGQFRVVNSPLNITTPAGGQAGTSTLYNVLNTWESFAVTRTGGTVYVYLNGALQVSAPASGGSATSPTMIIDHNFTNRDLIGLVDDVRIYSRALSAAEVAAMYNGGK